MGKTAPRGGENHTSRDSRPRGTEGADWGLPFALFYTSSEWPSEVSSGHQCSSGAAAALHEFGVAAAARCVVRRVEPLVPTAAAHSRRRRPIALPLDLPLDLPHGHQRDDLLPLRGATARLRAERVRGGISRNQSQLVAI